MLEFKGYESLDTDNALFFAKENSFAEKLVKSQDLKCLPIK